MELCPTGIFFDHFVLIGDAYGGKFCMRILIDEFCRGCLTIHGVLEYIFSNNGSEFIAQELRRWLPCVGVKIAYIEPSSLWKNGFCESFNGNFRNNLFDGELL